MIDRAAELAKRTATFQREERATVSALEEATGAYTVNYRGALVGPVWSINGVRYEVGALVTVIVEGNLIKSISP